MAIVLTHTDSVYFYGVLLFMIGYLLTHNGNTANFGRIVCIVGAAIFVLGWALHLLGVG